MADNINPTLMQEAFGEWWIFGDLEIWIKIWHLIDRTIKGLTQYGQSFPSNTVSATAIASPHTLSISKSAQRCLDLELTLPDCTWYTDCD